MKDLAKNKKQLLITITTDYNNDFGINVIEKTIREYLIPALVTLVSYRKGWHIEVEEVDQHKTNKKQ